MLKPREASMPEMWASTPGLVLHQGRQDVPHFRPTPLWMTHDLL